MGQRIALGLALLAGVAFGATAVSTFAYHPAKTRIDVTWTTAIHPTD